jgi:hypothetical protein
MDGQPDSWRAGDAPRCPQPPLFPDTSPEDEAGVLALLREAPPWHKLAMVGQLNQIAGSLSLCVLRTRDPEATPAELRCALPQLVLRGGKRATGSAAQAGPTAGQCPPTAVPIDVTLQVIEALRSLHVPYLMSGPLACAVHGVPRAAVDSDLVAELHSSHAEPLVHALCNSFCLDEEDVREAILSHGHFTAAHLQTLFEVHIYVARQRPFAGQRLHRRQPLVVAVDPERTADVASPEDTVLGILEWYRAGAEVSVRQCRDVLGVLRLQNERLDLPYLQHWATNLGVSDLLAQALAQAGLSPHR